jgi:hypothetical protein
MQRIHFPAGKDRRRDRVDIHSRSEFLQIYPYFAAGSNGAERPFRGMREIEAKRIRFARPHKKKRLAVRVETKLEVIRIPAR